ncbi:MAG: polyphenol oxidase family protein [Candidatus Peribacteraceae bacterium]|nr:polyphenol oxidase family protein [Candidatus Peribacteraceae bacterium]
MAPHSFALLKPFADRVRVELFTKERPAESFPACAQAVGVTAFATLNQVHGNRTVLMENESDRLEDADGMVTNHTDLALIVRGADCQIFVVYAPKQHVLGTLHAGWRGLVAGAIPAFFQTLRNHWGVAPAETYVIAGPSLCTQCAAFTDPEKELPTIPRRFVRGRCVDLRAAADAALRTLGVPSTHVERHPACTCCHPETYWTWRGSDREDVKAGQTNLLVCTLKEVLA